MRRQVLTVSVLSPAITEQSPPLDLRRVSNDRANAVATRLGRGVVTVVPVTSNTAHVYPFQVLLAAAATGLAHDSKAQAEQVRSVAVERVGGPVASVPPELMLELDEALRLHLQL